MDNNKAQDAADQVQEDINRACEDLTREEYGEFIGIVADRAMDSFNVFQAEENDKKRK